MSAPTVQLECQQGTIGCTGPRRGICSDFPLDHTLPVPNGAAAQRARADGLGPCHNSTSATIGRKGETMPPIAPREYFAELLAIGEFKALRTDREPLHQSSDVITANWLEAGYERPGPPED